MIAERGGRLGFSVKLLLETAEERGSPGLREFVSAHSDRLSADVLIASDGPRVAPEVPTIKTGTRGIFAFDLTLDLRPGGVHSGHWGGLDGCLVSGGEAATIDPEWGEPGLTAAEKIYGWNSFIVLAMLSGRPENPLNAVAPNARARCHIRYTVDTDPATFEPSLRRHLDAGGFRRVRIENAAIGMAASRTDPAHPWVRWAADSMERTLGKRVQVIPNGSGGLPGDVFVDHLGLPLVWVPHSYNGCRQHGPDEHFLPSIGREGIAAFAGLWWDFGEAGVPSRAPHPA